MRYRRLSYRYTMVVPSGQRWPFQDTWESDRLRFFVPARWRPDDFMQSDWRDERSGA